MKGQIIPHISKGARFSVNRLYRYDLWRTWDEHKGRVMFIGLNPSTADETLDDPTLRRCMDFAGTWGYGGVDLLNLFAYRSTNPETLRTVHDPIGPTNDKRLVTYAESASIIVAAWGDGGKLMSRAPDVVRLLTDQETDIYCLGHTKLGEPYHPLYMRKDTSLVRLQDP